MTVIDIITAHRAERYPLRAPVEIEPDHRLAADLGLTEMDRRELCMKIEEHFNLPRQINESRVFTVRHLMAAAERKVA